MKVAYMIGGPVDGKKFTVETLPREFRHLVYKEPEHGFAEVPDDISSETHVYDLRYMDKGTAVYLYRGIA